MDVPRAGQELNKLCFCEDCSWIRKSNFSILILFLLLYLLTIHLFSFFKICKYIEITNITAILFSMYIRQTFKQQIYVTKLLQRLYIT